MNNGTYAGMFNAATKERLCIKSNEYMLAENMWK